jgi:lipopolysaccharide/colanic/teichoic acid biosynthesis glycosyltransferase
MGHVREQRYLGDESSFGSSGDIGVRNADRRVIGLFLKRTVDIVTAGLLLLALSPVLLLVMVGIKLESPGPVIFRSNRVGRRGKVFPMLKFRKMRDDAAGPALTSLEDERFTRLGSFLARTRLDELPQLWNVVRGDMSVVGPRPEDPGFVAIYPEEFEVVLQVRPGITGLSQLAFADERRVLDGPDPVGRYVDQLLPQKIGMDRLYVAIQSTSLDIRIVVWTVLAVLFRVEVSVNRASGQLKVRRRPVAAARDEDSGPASKGAVT